MGYKYRENFPIPHLKINPSLSGCQTFHLPGTPRATKRPIEANLIWTFMLRLLKYRYIIEKSDSRLGSGPQWP